LKGILMNCQEFAERISELASDGRLESGVRPRAQAHAAHCSHCAARLAAQRALNARLREFAAATSQLPAPRVRQQLHAALAAQRPEPVASAAPVVELVAYRESRRRFGSAARWGWLAAAAVLALAALTVTFWQRARQAGPEEFNAAFPTPAPVLPPLPHVGATPRAPQVQAVQPALQVTVQSRPARRKPVLRQSGVQEELSSEFVPLTLAVDERALANRTFVRLEVPRARLVALGLPLSVHSDREMVQAEVMMGDNGVAYAIRLVQ
jgi:hypothetical protein